MIKRLRFVIVFLVLTLIGALQYAVPFFEEQNQQERAKFKIDVSYESESASANETVPIFVKDYSHVEQGSFFLERQGQEGYQLSPLINTNVDISVVGLIARAKVTQLFTNNTDHWVNGIYVFPLPENAAVDHLEMEIGERKIVGEIHPKQKAKAIYERAKRQGKKASLLSQQRANIFKNSVANIGPGESISVTIEYQQAVAYQSGEFSLRFPTTITPRYTPPGMIEVDDGWTMGAIDTSLVNTSSEDASSVELARDTHQTETDSKKSESAAKLNKVAIRVSLKAGFALDKIASEFHPIHVDEVAENQYEVKLQQNMIANQDFVLEWHVPKSYAPLAAHFSQPFEQSNAKSKIESSDKSSSKNPSSQTEHYGMVMLMPPVEANAQLVLPREVIFIIDTSGSMSGESMQQAKTALSMAIDQLAETDRFNLIEFNSTAHRMWANPKLASLDHKTDAKLFVGELKADGGTEMLSALQLALGNQKRGIQKSSNKESIRQVIFITDGAVGNETQLFEYVNDNLADSRLFTVGIGSAPNSYFMTEAAMMGKGTFTYIGSIDAVQKEMKTLFNKLSNPVLSDLLINFDDDVEFYPSQLPDLYQGEPLMISYKSASKPDKLMVSGNLKNQYWQKGLNLHEGSNQSGLDVLWARRKIAQLERNKVFGQDKDSLDKAIETVAMKHHLVSSMTSLVAVDVIPTALEIAKEARAKAMLPKGMLRGIAMKSANAVGTLPKTATLSELYALLGLILMGVGLCTVIFTRSR